jgi:hypothetical protein
VKTWVCNTLASFFGPLQGSARLYAYLRKEGHDVCLKDFNQDAYFALLSRECLEQTLEKLRRTVDATKRSRFLREDVGSILLHSSSDAARQLLAKGILTGSPWYRFIKTGNAVKKPVFRFINSRIKPDNVFYALLNDREFVLSEVEKAREVLDKQFLSLAPDEFFGHFYTLLCGKALIDAAYFPAQLDFGLGFHGTAYAPSGSDIMRLYPPSRWPI